MNSMHHTLQPFNINNILKCRFYLAKKFLMEVESPKIKGRTKYTYMECLALTQ